MVKPRVRMAWRGWWVCTSLDCLGHGRTPTEAYAHWQRVRCISGAILERSAYHPPPAPKRTPPIPRPDLFDVLGWLCGASVVLLLVLLVLRLVRGHG